MTATPSPSICVCTPGCEFLHPYLAQYTLCDDFTQASHGVYKIAVVSAASESDPRTAAADTVLVCPNIVGTRMNGLPRVLAEAIASGRLYHIAGAEAHISTVHASDIAQAVQLAAGSPGRFVVTDGTDTTVSELVEALAYRINQKRILTLKPLWAKFLMSRQLRNILTTDHTADGAPFIERFGFKPTPVTKYLTTHVYDDESL